MDWDDAYANAAYIPHADKIADRWAQQAAAFRASASGQLDVAYGPGARRRYDLFLPDGPARGLFVFVHGGYWMSFDKSSWSHLAGGAVARGWAAVLPSYTLAPDASLTEIAGEVSSAVAHAAARIDGPVALTGHSAGGHLVARLMCEGGPLADDMAARVRRVIGISGVYDLRPIRKTRMNETLKITEGEALTESPVLLRPRVGFSMTAWVGADERPEFIRQSNALGQTWNCDVVIDPARHHFDVIDGLAEADSALTAATLAGIDGA